MIRTRRFRVKRPSSRDRPQRGRGARWRRPPTRRRRRSNHRRATTDLAGGSAGSTRSMTIASSLRRRDQMQLPVASDSMRSGARSVSISSRSWRRDLFLDRAFAAASARAGSRGCSSSKCCQAENSSTSTRTPATRPIPTARAAALVDLADDRVVANVLLDGVFERLHHVFLSSARQVEQSSGRSRAPTVPATRQADRSATRSFALRARGLVVTSASVGTIGFFVSTRTASAAPCASAAQGVLHDAVFERVKGDDDQARPDPQPAQRPSPGTGRALRARWFTQMRSA